MRLKKNGMTLVEVIVAIALFGIITVSFLMMYTNSYAYIYSAGRKTTALSVAEKNLEVNVASGTAAAGSTLAINFGGTSLNISGEVVSKTQTYDNGTRSVVVSSFVPINSVASGKPDTSVEAKLEVYANEKTLRVGETFTIETNKPATFSIDDSMADKATVDASTGVVTALVLGTEVIKVTPVSTTYPGDFKLVTINITNDKKLMDVKGGEYVSLAGVKYQKLTGLNGRVMEINVSGSPIKWNSNLSAPTKEELEGDNWTSALRVLANEYWTRTVGSNNNAGQFVSTSGDFDNSPNAGDKKYLRNATALDQHLKVTTGTGAYSDPYILINE